MNEAPTADGGPGFLAFLAFFVLALALWFLMRNMNARMRRMSYRQQAAHRGKDDPQAGPDEVDLEVDGPRGHDRRPADDDAGGRPAARGHRALTAGPHRPLERQEALGVDQRSGGRGPGEGQRGGDEVRREREDGQGVEDLVEAEPPR